MPVRPLEGQSSAYLASRLQHLLAFFQQRKQNDPTHNGSLSLLERQVLSAWQSAYKRAIRDESRLDALLSKHLKAG